MRRALKPPSYAELQEMVAARTQVNSGEYNQGRELKTSKEREGKKKMERKREGKEEKGKKSLN